MNLTKKQLRIKKKYRIRKLIYGTAKRPRLSFYKSNTNLYVQIINDDLQKTLTEASTLKMNDLKSKSNLEAAKKLANVLAPKMKKLNIKNIVFDRNGYIYHGKIKLFAETLRELGIEF